MSQENVELVRRILRCVHRRGNAGTSDCRRGLRPETAGGRMPVGARVEARGHRGHARVFADAAGRSDDVRDDD